MPTYRCSDAGSHSSFSKGIVICTGKLKVFFFRECIHLDSLWVAINSIFCPKQTVATITRLHQIKLHDQMYYIYSIFCPKQRIATITGLHQNYTIKCIIIHTLISGTNRIQCYYCADITACSLTSYIFLSS